MLLPRLGPSLGPGLRRFLHTVKPHAVDSEINPASLSSDLSLVDTYRSHPCFNLSSLVESKLGKNLHLLSGHPIHTVSYLIQKYFKTAHLERMRQALSADESINKADICVKCFDRLSPIVTKFQNFDNLLFPLDHISRNPTDTYYLDDTHMLRCHTTAHQSQIIPTLSHRELALIVGDVYRRDTIDHCHYPVFHQLDAVRLFDQRPDMSDDGYIVQDLKEALDGMIRYLFSDSVKIRWVDAYFPFTHPSFEMEIFVNGNWLEILGCGVIHPLILSQTGCKYRRGWAFGIGLERITMSLFNIPDIRLFWSEDPRFKSQFVPEKVTPFKPFSNQPSCFKDISFWIHDSYQSNDLFEIIRQETNEMAEAVTLIDTFRHPVTQRESHCYRIHYRSMHSTLTNEQVDELQNNLRQQIVEKLKVELR
ncbi:phenylalanine--tRNA ligase, mitochondrial-like [Schistocerca gregaria]|uniref:phenylalanine--tRNA ligase, mitochondrial-like n=1 Tax=Schistocerca gregaria TaxID=7010 RepID=UPI00211F3909|nr:phenylalanine--tRNA ligase, mitochondrial-like [Schistocerca gregaria]